MGKKDTHYCNCLYYTANALARVMTRLAEEEFAVLGLTPSYAFLIITVHDKPGIQPGEISEELQLTPSTVTRLIEKLESKDLLIRRTLGKFTEVTLTPRGIEMTEVIRTCWETEDMGKAEAARAIEPLCILWCIPGLLRNQWTHAFRRKDFLQGS